MRIVGGINRGQQLLRVGKESTRETADMVKVAVFNMLGSNLSGVCLDLFAGAGSYGFEALSRGCDLTYFVDMDKDAINIIHQNAKRLDLVQKSMIQLSDYKKFIKTMNQDLAFDYVFLDPPYDLNIYEQTITDLDSHIHSDGFVICESKKEIVLKDQLGSFEKIKEKTYGIKRITIYQK